MLFEDPLSHPSVLKAVDKAVASPESSQAVVSSRSVAEGIHEEPVHRSVHAYPTPPSYDEEFLRRVGRSNVPVLLHGETGVGKEVMARKLWTYSNRVTKPFLKLNCAALPSELIESELFGYEKGAFHWCHSG